ncbi:MAG: Pseudomurein-binding repeat protein [Methanobacterium sp. PtaU1.Bin242]|nr:MAG: Pseudomurein-binding repeat protein [Methanobacterium sp. PtaU1.Bin242]
MDSEAVKIYRKSMLAVLILLSITLTLSMNFASATTPVSTDSNQTGSSDQSLNQGLNGNIISQKDQKLANDGNQQITSQNNQLSNSKQSEYLAAGSTSTAATSSQSVTFTIDQVNQAASSVKSFIDTNNRLPNYVTISGQQIIMPQFLQLLGNAILNINSGKTSSITLKDPDSPINPTESVKSGSIQKTEYVKLVENLNSFINTNGRLPNYVTSSLGKIRYESLIYMCSKILVFYDTNNRLPSSVSITPWTGITITDPALLPYLQPTDNCQSTSSTITSLAASITSTLTSTYAKAAAIFNWVRDNVSYSFYYNTKKGALGALSSRTANCCDTSHLVVALARAAGIPARYQHGSCTFSDGVFGHVWAQLYVNGKWYYADAISDSNTFGTINNWSLKTLYGTYVELPF